MRRKTLLLVWLAGIIVSFVAVSAVAAPPDGWRELDISDVTGFDGGQFATQHSLDREDFYIKKDKLYYVDSVAALTTSQLPLLPPVNERVDRGDRLTALLLMKALDSTRFNALDQATRDECDTQCGEWFDDVEAALGQ